MAESPRAESSTAEPPVPFAEDPLGLLDQAFAGGAGSARAGRQLILGDTAAARTVLLDDAGLYAEHSDFFHTRRGTFGPRSVQVEMGRASRALLNSYLKEKAGELPAAVHRALAPGSEWPDAGNWLIYRHLADALAAPGSSDRVRLLLDRIVERAVRTAAWRPRSPCSWSRTSCGSSLAGTG